MAKNSNVVLASRDIEKLNKISDQINNDGGRSIAVKTDITNLDSCKNMLNESVATFGKIDSLILNAGMGLFFRDNGGEYIYSAGDGDLRIQSGDK